MNDRRRGAATGPGPVIWLASYPKSGNTWVRALLSNYVDGGDEPASINCLIGGNIVVDRGRFDDMVGLASSDLAPSGILKRRPAFHVQLAAELPRPTFVKVHDACLRVAPGTWLFPAAATAGSVCIVRNPLDVAVSFAHHNGGSIDDAIALMNRPSELARQCTGMTPQLPQPMLTWSGHVWSWVRQAEFPVHVLKYEDMLADPVATFGRIVRFARLDYDSARLSRAIENASFDLLRRQEAQTGFSEAMSSARSFFRAGKAGAWRAALDRRQVTKLLRAHGPLMARFGYLAEAQAFLDDRPAG